MPAYRAVVLGIESMMVLLVSIATCASIEYNQVRPMLNFVSIFYALPYLWKRQKFYKHCSHSSYQSSVWDVPFLEMRLMYLFKHIPGYYKAKPCYPSQPHYSNGRDDNSFTTSGMKLHENRFMGFKLFP